MKARIRTDSTGNITVHMEGGIDFENTVPLRKELETLAADNPTATITLDLHSLEFVGSSGISFFVETLRSLNNRKDQIRLSNVRSEFLKVFKLYDFDVMDILIQEFDDDETETLGQRFSARKHTFQN